MQEMVGQILVNPLIEELAPKVSVQPELVSRSFSDPVDLIDTLGASSAMLSDTGAKPLLPALTARTPTPRRAPSALSVGILLYLLSIGIVATATVGVFFGIAFFFLAQTTQPMNENAAAGEHGSDTERPLSHAVPSTPSTHGGHRPSRRRLQATRRINPAARKRWGRRATKPHWTLPRQPHRRRNQHRVHQLRRRRPREPRLSPPCKSAIS